MLAALGDDDAAIENQRFHLRRPSGQFEFRDVALRVFNRIEDDQVLVDAIGRKYGNQLFISGTKVIL
jgi:hypothetical protein